MRCMKSPSWSAKASRSAAPTPSSLSPPMHDIAAIRKDPAGFDAALKRRGLEPMAQDLLKLDAEKRGGQTELQQMLARRNEVAKQIGEAMRTDKSLAEKL